MAPAQYVQAELTVGRLVPVDTPGSQVDGTWAISTLGRPQVSPNAAELARFVSTPRAIQAMLSGSGVNISHFRPAVHITLWSQGRGRPVRLQP